ncbi:AbaSI family restriction endonuclease [Peribacillus sp. NPDC058075]|uniref:AbaSI family restriction endonuclease n=1 Tax=unclassified Peribacillus TaxID=2675266 RepID=UPI0036DEC978
MVAKREYLVRTFSRTKRKDYENYILNRIWNRLNRLDLKPVTQQYIKRADGKYALIDLYFPQIHLGIECDEGFHIRNELNDEIRTLEIGKMYQAVKENEIRIERVDATESIEAIHTKIEEIVQLINKMASNSKIISWSEDVDYAELAIKNGVLSIYDEYTFSTITEAMRCLGKNYKGIQRAYWKFNEQYMMWFPQLSFDTGKGKVSNARGWINVFNQNWTEIEEKRMESDYTPYNLPEGTQRNRITFMKVKDPVFGTYKYQFVGIFQWDRIEDNRVIFKRIAEEIDLTPYNRMNR